MTARLKRGAELAQMDQAKLVLYCLALEEQRDALVAACVALDDIYTYAWDRVEGGLLLMELGVAKYETAHEKVRKAIALATGK